MDSGNSNRQAADLRTLAYRLIQVANDIDKTEAMQEDALSSPYKREADSILEYDIDFAGVAQRLYDQRRRRNHFFSGKLFSEPAWDILLDLFVQNSRGRPVSVTSACIAGEIPTTTGLRWIKILESEGLIEREGSESDARVTWLRLTPKATTLMKQYISDRVSTLEPALKRSLDLTAAPVLKCD